MTLSYTVGQLKQDLAIAEDSEPIVVVIDDNVEGIEELEEGSVLDIAEAGGFMAGMRIIRVRPR